MDYIVGLFGNICIFIILAQSLHLVNGVSGQFSLGHAAFWGIGAYAGALVSLHAPLFELDYANALVACLVAFGFTAGVACLIGYPCSRLRGDYLAITTLGFGEMIKAGIENLEITGGSRGLAGIPHFVDVPFIVGATILIVVVLNNFLRSRYGRLLFAVGEDALAAEFLGLEVAPLRLAAFCLGCGLAGLAGSLFAHYQQYIHPSNFTFTWGVIILLMTIVGGMGNSLGAILGAIGITVLPELLRLIGNMAEYRMILFSALLMVIMLFKPNGLTRRVKISIFGGGKTP